VPSGIGADTANVAPATVIVANGPVPPPERINAPVLAAGDTLPSLLRVNDASRPTHAEPTRLRTGTAALVNVNVPSGLALSVSVGVVEPTTSTGTPLALARADA